MTKKKRFVFIDSNSIIHRAYHAYPPQLATSKGEQTNAIYGFTAILLKAIEELKPDFIICVFDIEDKPTIRHKKFPDYKGHRKPVEEELLKQIPRIKEIVKAFNIPILEIEGYEADDIIGTLEIHKDVKPLEKIIVTGDQDIFQLVDYDTEVFLSGRNFRDSKLYGPSDVKKKVGISPEQIVDYKALYGDPSDNIPGVKGIGKQGAVYLLKRYKSLDGIYKNIDKVEGRYKRKLVEGRDDALLSRDLATIIKDVPVDFDLKSGRWADFQVEKVRAIFQELEFRSLLKRLNKTINIGDSSLGSTEIPKGNKQKTTVIQDKEAFMKFLKKVEGVEIVAIDLDDFNESPLKSKPSFILLTWGKGIFCIDVSLDKEVSLWKKFVNILESGKVLKVGYNLKPIIQIFENIGIKLGGISFDIMIGAHLSQGGGRINFEELAFNYLGEVINRDDKLTLLDQDLKRIKERAKEIGIIWQLYKRIGNKSTNIKVTKDTKEWNAQRLNDEIETPLIPVLAEMERAGIRVDKRYLKKFSSDLRMEIRKEEKKVFNIVGHEFNLSSPKQVGEVLFDELDLPKPPRTKSGNYCTHVGVLKNLIGTNPIIEHILSFRELSKLESTYTSSWLEAINEDTGRIHTTYNQVGTVTGRFSSQDPNMQNIPIAKDLGKKIRKAFVPERGAYLISCDYSQQELRILAHLSNEQKLIDAFNEGIDVHRLTAANIFGKGINKVTKKERDIGKTINFSIMYGMGAYGLSSLLKISFEEASDFIVKYFDNYSSVKDYFDGYIEEAQNRGYAETMFGRIKNTTLLKSSGGIARNAILRETINFPIQGSAADMMKLAMVKVFKLIKRRYAKKAKMILQIHDELIFEFKNSKERRKEFIDEVKSVMEEVVSLKVPLEVQCTVGKNLMEVH